MKRVVSRVIGTVFVQASAAILLFALSVILARKLNQPNFGAYEYADAWAEVLILFALLGFDRLLVRQVATENQRGAYHVLWRLLRYAWRRVLAASVLLAGAVALLMTVIFGLIQPAADSQLILVTVWLMLVVVPLRVLMKFNQASLQGMQRVVLAYLPDYVLRPALLLLLVWMLADAAPEVALASQTAALAALIVSAGFFFRFMPHATVEEPFSPHHHLSPSIPFMLISGVNLINLRGGAVMVGLVADLETVGLYAVAVRVAAVIALTLAATSAVAAPQIAHLYNQRDMQGLQRFITWTTRGIVAMALPAALFFIFWGDWVLSWFGAEYVAAHRALALLSLGQIVNAATGVVGWVLIMTHHEKRMVSILIVSVVLHLLGIAGLTPVFGASGAAAATALTNAASNLAMVHTAHRRLQIKTTIF